MTEGRLKSPASILFIQSFIQAEIKENILKLRVTGLCVGNSPGPVNSPHKGPVTRKMFPFDDVIMLQDTEVRSALLVQIMTCHLVSNNPLSESILATSFGKIYNQHLKIGIYET